MIQQLKSWFAVGLLVMNGLFITSNILLPTQLHPELFHGSDSPRHSSLSSILEKNSTWHCILTRDDRCATCDFLNYLQQQNHVHIELLHKETFHGHVIAFTVHALTDNLVLLHRNKSPPIPA